MNLSSVINQLISLFLMMFVGFIAAKAGIVTPDFRKKLSHFTLNIAGPGVILSSALDSDISGGSMLLAVGTAVLFYVLTVASAAVLVRLTRTPKAQQGMDQLLLIFTNVGFMGIPVVQSVYGLEGVAYVSMFILVFNLLFFSYGLALISGRLNFNIRSMCNPCIVAAVLAFFFGVTGLHLPAALESTLSSIGAMNTPLAMIIIGASLAHSDVRAALTNPRLYRVGVLSMIVMPLIAFAAMRALPLPPVLIGVAVLEAAMPIAGNCGMASDIYTPEDMTASHAIIVSTLMSALTLPLFSAMLLALL